MSRIERIVIVGILLMRGLSASALQRGWDDETHGRDAVPDYDRIFDQTSVKRLDIKVSPDRWQMLLDDMENLAGPRETTTPGSGGVGNMFTPQQIQACAARVEGDLCTFGTPPSTGRCTQVPGNGLMCIAQGGGQRGQQPVGPGGGGGPNQARDDVELFGRTPIYVESTIVYDGIVFEHVGIRLKGNSSLSNSWRSGVDKLPFRLNFAEFEDRYPEIRDQTFFGFPNLSLTSNSQDTSFLRAKVVGDLFRESGVPTARTTFVRIYLDRGTGPVYSGLYTMIEVPDKPMLEHYFGSNDGNLYKPAGTGARWAQFIAESFPKRTNRDDEDWTDVEDAIGVLNGSRADASLWRRRMEARFDVNGFLRWLAVNTIIGNTDTYGSFSPHNYYVYGSPRHRDKLFWIPWDHDLAMGTGPGGAGGEVDVFQNNVNATWPLIRFFMDDPVYRATYRRYVEELIANNLTPGIIVARLQAQHDFVAPHVVGPDGEQPGRTFLTSTAEFETSVSGPNGLAVYYTSRIASIERILARSQ